MIYSPICKCHQDAQGHRFGPEMTCQWAGCGISWKAHRAEPAACQAVVVALFSTWQHRCTPALKHTITLEQERGIDIGATALRHGVSQHFVRAVVACGEGGV